MSDGTLMVITAHPGDFVWRAGGALALASSEGRRAVIACLSYGERGESARLWRAGASLDEIKATREEEATRAARVLGAEIHFFDAGDYPLRGSDQLTTDLVALLRSVQPSVILTHAVLNRPGPVDTPSTTRSAQSLAMRVNRAMPSASR